MGDRLKKVAGMCLGVAALERARPRFVHPRAPIKPRSLERGHGEGDEATMRAPGLFPEIQPMVLAYHAAALTVAAYVESVYTQWLVGPQVSFKFR